MNYQSMTKEINKFFVSYETALMLKNFGINFPTFGYYCYDINDQMQYKHPAFEHVVDPIKDVEAPLTIQVIDWIRDEYNMNIEIHNADSGNYVYSITNTGPHNLRIKQDGNWPYNEAQEKGIKEAILIIEKEINLTKINDINKNFVTYEIAKILQEKGFNLPCIKQYVTKGRNKIIDCVNAYNHPIWKTNTESIFDSCNDCISAPMWQQVEDWLRIKHNIYIEICISPVTFVENFEKENETKKYKFQFLIVDMKINDYLYHSLNENITYDLNSLYELKNEAYSKALTFIK